MAQWDGTSPLRPEHEVAYRGWPKEEATIIMTNLSGSYPVVAAHPGWLPTRHKLNGKHSSSESDSDHDLIHLQQEQSQ